MSVALCLKSILVIYQPNYIDLSYELTRVHVSDMFYNAELEDEHYTNHDNFRWTRTKKQDREDKLKEIIENGIGASYHHNPHKECAAKGIVDTLVSTIGLPPSLKWPPRLLTSHITH